MYLTRFVAPAVAAAGLAFALYGVGCSAGRQGSGFGDDPNANADAGSDAEILDDEGGLISADAYSVPPGCKGLECQQVVCSGGGTTTLKGKVYDPAGRTPLFNIVVYVPNAPLDPIKQGVSCEKCGTTPSGKPLVTAISGTDGTFVLDNVPSGKDVPIVLQNGKWRRKATIVNIDPCKENVLPDVTAAWSDQQRLQMPNRLPRNAREGDLPYIGMASGGCDPFECLLRKIGISDEEFTNESGTGHVHLYQGSGGMVLSNAVTSKATVLWGSLQQMEKYDILINSCECFENSTEKPTTSLQAMVDYTNKGGRMFATHYHYYWIKNGISPFNTAAQFLQSEAIGPDSISGLVDDTFPKGQALRDWLFAVGASSTLGVLPIVEARYNAMGITQGVSTRWVHATNTSTSTSEVFNFTFNTPIGLPADQQCGRVVFSDYHVSGSARSGTSFPSSCTGGNFTTAQEKALEFMLFDLSSCILDDKKSPEPPPR